jgi:hypothetical protein
MVSSELESRGTVPCESWAPNRVRTVPGAMDSVMRDGVPLGSTSAGSSEPQQEQATEADGHRQVRWKLTKEPERPDDREDRKRNAHQVFTAENHGEDYPTRFTASEARSSTTALSDCADFSVAAGVARRTTALGIPMCSGVAAAS